MIVMKIVFIVVCFNYLMNIIIVFNYGKYARCNLKYGRMLALLVLRK